MSSLFSFNYFLIVDRREIKFLTNLAENIKAIYLGIILMQRLLRKFGRHDLTVSTFGYGCGQTGGNDLTDKEVSYLLNSLLDLGINFFDTARAYGLSEERIGKSISHRRDEFVISTKVGYGIPGCQDWTCEIISAGIDYALKLLRTDHIDIVHLHSCPIHVLENNGVAEALTKCLEQGKILVAGYSGENESLEYTAATDKFGSIQLSVNICDQRAIDTIIPEAKIRAMGVIAKRAVANAPWRFVQQPHGQYVEEYWLRWKSMNIETDLEWNELFTRFTAFTEGVDTMIIGSKNIDHIKSNLSSIQKGPLPMELYSGIRNLFKQSDKDWLGQL